MKSKTLLAALGVVAFVLFVAVSSEAQLPKQGTAKIHSGWIGIGEAKQFGKDQVVWTGIF